VSDRFRLNVLEIIRGAHKIYIDIRHTALQAGDLLLVRGSVEDIVAFREHYRLLLLTDIKLQDTDFSDHHTILAELQLSPLSRFVVKTLKEIDFRNRFDCFVLALSRTSEFIREKLASIPLDRWDTLLVFGPRSRVEALYDLDDFLPLGERELRLHLTTRWWISALIIPLVVVLAATGTIPILKASILGMVALLVTRCITIQQAYRAIDWTVIFLLAAVLPLGIAMESTGLARAIGELFAPVGERYGPTVMLSLVYLSANLLTAIFSNSATAVLMVPVAIAAAGSQGLDPKPFLMAVAYAASVSFITPVGYQTNAMVFSPGNYRFMDYVRYGTPLTILYWVLATALIPVIWPF
jgi:di/tricarboxylate transporter